VVQVILRVALFVLCSFVVWRTTGLAVADHLAHDGSAADFDRAIDLEPGDESLLAGRAIFRSDEGALKKAVAMNPLDAAAWMTLGLRAESRGDAAEAERDLVQAAAVDHTFKPAWTLANYYFRANQPEKFRGAIARCLSLIEPKDIQPVSFDPTPVFDLCWHQTESSKSILAKSILDLVPRREQTLVPYLKYLYATDRTDAALEAWPEALRVANYASPADADALIGFSEHLIRANRIPEAVEVWNELAERKIVPAEDPGFSAPAIGRGFSWRIEHPPGVYVTEAPRTLKFEFTGDEAEDCELLWKFAPVSPERTWRLVWQADSSRVLANAGHEADAGFRFEIGEPAGKVFATCPARPGSCEFKTSSGTRSVRLSLRYTRAPGMTRVKGILVLSSVRLELRP
jgi:tetratricopeptide (TPR) repeat protein